MFVSSYFYDYIIFFLLIQGNKIQGKYIDLKFYFIYFLITINKIEKVINNIESSSAIKFPLKISITAKENIINQKIFKKSFLRKRIFFSR